VAKKTLEEVVPAAFITGALTYQSAGDELFKIRYEPAKNMYGLDPVYTLYLHAVELALKGLLRAHGRTTTELFNMKHGLMALYQECEKLMSGIDAATWRSVQEVISLLAQGNKNQGFRYYSPTGRGMPELGWTREVVEIVVQAARAGVLAVDPDAERPGMAVKMDFTTGKPVPK